MIRLSREADYGIVLLAQFACESERLTHSARKLSRETYLPFPMVSKVLKALTRQGFLVSQRGVKGGYSLARRPERITVAEIIGALEGPIAVTECTDTHSDCKHDSVCQLRPTWQKINAAVLLTLDKIALSDLIRTLPGQAGMQSGSPSDLVRLQ